MSNVIKFPVKVSTDSHGNSIPTWEDQRFCDKPIQPSKAELSIVEKVSLIKELQNKIRWLWEEINFYKK